MTVGPTKPGQPPNMYTTIICDPDEKKFEGMWPGLLYTMVSRATTLGDEDGNGSALYFDAPLVGSVPLTTERLSNLLCKAGRPNSSKPPELYENVRLRNAYVDSLRRNLFSVEESTSTVLMFLQEMEQLRLSEQTLTSKIEMYSLTLYLKNEAP